MDETTRTTGGAGVQTASPAAVEAATSGSPATALERYKASLRRYSPVQRGLSALPWEGEWLCARCGETGPGRLLREPEKNAIVLEHDCPRCGSWREPHADVLFTTLPVAAHPRQPRATLSGMPIRPIPRALPRTVETLCPECSCLVLGRSNGVKLAEPGFAEQAAGAGLQTVYLQFDGVDDAIYRKLRGAPLLETKLAAVEACRRAGIRICLVPTLVKGVNDDQVGPIFRFAVENADVINAIAYQPVAFTGRIARHELEAKRYTLGDLAAAIAKETGAEVHEDFFPASLVTPVSRFLQVLEGKPKIRLSCHADCGIGTYFFITPEGDTVPIPRMFDLMRLFSGLNDLAAEIEGRGKDARPTRSDYARAGWLFLRSYRWRNMRRSITPWGFVKALRAMTDKGYGRGEGARKAYRTIMTGGMHFMDRYNFDTERVRRCVIQYSTPDGLYPFCTINTGPSTGRTSSDCTPGPSTRRGIPDGRRLAGGPTLRRGLPGR